MQEKIQAQTDGSATDTLTVAFWQPAIPSKNLQNMPLVSLSPQFSSIGGTLPAGSNFYYAVTAVDSTRNEGPLSFTVPVLIAGNANTNQVTISGLSFPRTAVQFNVYRGSTPQELYRIASSLPLSGAYTDSGAAPEQIGPPDASFDHANFYYRHEYAGPFVADVFSASTIGRSDMGAVSSAYSGMVARIIEGIGRGQERLIAANTDTTLTVSSKWSVLPDATSQFVVADGSWKFAAVTATSPARFEIPYQTGTAIQISGRAANVANQECAADLCPLTRCTLGGGKADAGIAGIPNFTLTAAGGGALTLTQVGFNDLTNTSSVTSGTLQLYAWNELLGPSPYTLVAALDSSTTLVQSAQPSSFSIGDVIQIDTEMMTIVSPNSGTNTYTVARGSSNSSITSHSSGRAILPLSKSVVIVPFAFGFFENRASQNFIHTLSLPDCRVSAAEFFVTNSFGESLTNVSCYLSGPETGLRTLSGGQFSFQVSGFLTTQQNAAPQLVVEAAHAVRDVRANLAQAAAGYTVEIDLLQNGVEYCGLAINSGKTSSATIVDGLSLVPLAEGAMLTMNLSVTPLPGFTGSASPGRDLTVTVRL